MAIERKNTALEFETMLRRHLKSGGAPVAVCAGFDFDAASAYLEDALGGSQRAGYESHLAGCAACRRHLIELSRLAKTISHAGTQPATVADKTPAWVRWREVVAGWFDLSAWNLKWQMIGVVGAAFAILIAALGVQSWRQAAKPANIASLENAASASAVESKVQPLTPEPSPQDALPLVAMDSGAVQQGQLRVPVPTPLVRPKDSEPNVAVAPAPDSMSLPSSQSNGAFSFDFRSRQDALADAQQSRNAVWQSRISPQGAPAPSPNNLHNLSRPDLANLRARARQAADSAVQSPGNELAARITPPRGYDPMNSKPPEPEPRLQTLASRDSQIAPMDSKPPEPGLRSKTQTEKSSSPFKLSKIASALGPWSKPNPRPESERKAKPDASDDESPKRLIDYIRDKVFRFEKDMWIDQDYKPEMQEWRVHPLARGSKEYKQVLADEPLLKEFFDRAPVIVVWNNKIYKVK